MALGKRSLMNEHMIAVLNKVRSMDPEPVQKSYLYYSQAEKEAVDYMIAIDLLTETSFEDDDGNVKKGYILGDFGREVVRDITRIQMKIDLQERIFEDPSQKDKISDLKDIRRELNSAVYEIIFAGTTFVRLTGTLRREWGTLTLRFLKKSASFRFFLLQTRRFQCSWKLIPDAAQNTLRPPKLLPS